MSVGKEQSGRINSVELFGVLYDQEGKLDSVRMALTALLGVDWFGSGSFLTESLMPKEYPGGSLLRKMRGLRKKPVNIERRVIDEVKIPEELRKKPTLDMLAKLGAIKSEQLSAESYGFYKVWQILLPNEDFSTHDLTGDPRECARSVAAILALELAMGREERKNTVVGVRDYYNRTLINVWEQSSAFDGTNYIIFPKNHHNLYREMINLRSIAQTGYVDVGLAGNHVEGKVENMNLSVEMKGQPKNVGEWLMHTARAIRMMVMHGLQVSQLDVDSFSTKLNNLVGIDEGERINLEAVVQVVGNLLVADLHNEKLTQKLIHAVGLHKYLGKARYFEIKEGMEVAELQLWGTIDSARGKRKGKYRRFSDLSKKMAQYMVVSAQQFYELVPIPENREKVEAIMVKSGDRDSWVQVCTNAIPAVEQAIHMALRDNAWKDEMVKMRDLLSYLYGEIGVEEVYPDVLV